MGRRLYALAGTVVAALAVAAGAAAEPSVHVPYPRPGVTGLVSLTASGEQGASGVGDPIPTSDGRFVTFFASGPEWADGLASPFGDVFIRDIEAGTLELISKAADGGSADLASMNARPSDDGRYVMFLSSARNLIAGEPVDPKDFHVAQPYLRDRVTQTTTRLSTLGAVRPAMTRDASRLAWHSFSLHAVDNKVYADIYLHERATGTTRIVSRTPTGGETIGSSTAPQFSPDGRFLIFDSVAANLVAKDTNGRRDAFMLDLDTPGASIELVSLGADDNQGTHDSFSNERLGRRPLRALRFERDEPRSL